LTKKKVLVCAMGPPRDAPKYFAREFGAAHIAEGVSVHGAVAQEVVSGTVELIGAAAGDDIDLAAAAPPISAE